MSDTKHIIGDYDYEILQEVKNKSGVIVLRIEDGYDYSQSFHFYDISSQANADMLRSFIDSKTTESLSRAYQTIDELRVKNGEQASDIWRLEKKVEELKKSSIWKRIFGI